MPISIDASSRLKDLAKTGNLIAVIGTGVSIALTNNTLPALSWQGLIEDGFNYGVQKGLLSAAQKSHWQAQLSSQDLDELLSAAEFIGRKLGAREGDMYARWLQSAFEKVTPQNEGMKNAIAGLQAAGVLLCTLNYDSLLEKVTGLESITLNETAKVTAWMRRERQGILHLHGIWENPSTCILGIRDYETTINSEFRNLVQRSLSSLGRLLFLGCGATFADPNFVSLIRWLRSELKTATPQHYALVRDDEVEIRHKDPNWRGFVEPVGFGSDYRELPKSLLSEFPRRATAPKRKKTKTRKEPSSNDVRNRSLKDYKDHLLRDCGQMTIEGMRADFDAAQRKFDLEKLFVPLTLLPTPPAFSESDTQREQKLEKWKEKNKEPKRFGDIFKKNRTLALLALPGGGKSMLLKRLAVAYADEKRRSACDDGLPDLDLMPILIRCREWRDYIRRPIPSLLDEIGQVIGKPELTGFYDALVPLLKKGRVLLLIDGLDEIHNDADRLIFAENLEGFIQQYKALRVVVTSREAGFSLVAPSISRCCERWHVAPLEIKAIRGLCNHWHTLMRGDTAGAAAESDEVVNRLLHNNSLRRLAENPLLLTMLLVVKHGAGRFPGDRVSLYDRAIEVLLDTWNIKGHEPLNLKEAVPQLACVAFELMRQGKQTATGSELLKILEESRDSVPQIKRYAKDAPDEFLKRVELRSSLLVEAGHQAENGRVVPFYQFRHLTFQEHLAAIAAAEGHYIGYKKDDTVLSPLEPYLHSEEWKEIVPMAAVLARKQAEPLIVALVNQATTIRNDLYENIKNEELERWFGFKLPVSVAHLTHCLAEEAEASPETLASALQLVALFARGCLSDNNWTALAAGPYGDELIQQGWLLYESMDWPVNTWIRNTVAVLCVLNKPTNYWETLSARENLVAALESDEKREIILAMLTIAGFRWGPGSRSSGLKGSIKRISVGWVPLDLLERHLLSEDRATWYAAAWAWALIRREPTDKLPRTSIKVLDLLLGRWLNGAFDRNAAFPLTTITDLSRDFWRPHLSETDLDKVRTITADLPSQDRRSEINNYLAGLIVAFHVPGIWTDEELESKFSQYQKSFSTVDLNSILDQLPSSKNQSDVPVGDRGSGTADNLAADG